MAQATQERAGAADDVQRSNGRAPESPAKLGGRGWFGVLKRSGREFSADNLTDWAAALTYYGVLAIFPALIALVSILGLVADPQATTQKVTQIVTQIGPSSSAQ